jgi:hypothetical protein
LCIGYCSFCSLLIHNVALVVGILLFESTEFKDCKACDYNLSICVAVRYFDTVISAISLKCINLDVWIMPYLREVVFQFQVTLICFKLV